MGAGRLEPSPPLNDDRINPLPIRFPALAQFRCKIARLDRQLVLLRPPTTMAVALAETLPEGFVAAFTFAPARIPPRRVTATRRARPIRAALPPATAAGTICGR